TAHAGEGFLEDVTNIQLGTPAKTFGEGQCQRIAVVDLGKQISVGRIDAVAADHAGVGIEGHQSALTGTATAHHEVHRFGVQQQAGHDAQVDIGEVMVV